jgi:hypothetical protein
MRIFTWVGILAPIVVGTCAAAADDIAANETAAAAGCKAYAEAQEIYRRTDYDADGLLEYAQSIRGGKIRSGPPPDLSKLPKANDEERKKIDDLIKKLASENFADRESADKELTAFGTKVIQQCETTAKEHKDAEVVARCNELKKAALDAVSPKTSKEMECGLAYFVANGQEQELGLVDRSFANAEVTSAADIATATPKAGYLYRVLTKQGKSATGGARSYIAGTNMTLGYAALAFPKTYGETGKKVFMINNNGTIFEKDLGSKDATESFVKDCDTFDPDTTWAASE